MGMHTTHGIGDILRSEPSGKDHAFLGMRGDESGGKAPVGRLTASPVGARHGGIKQEKRCFKELF